MKVDVVNGSTWSTIRSLSVSFNETGYNGLASNATWMTSTYNNIRMHREVTLAHASQNNRPLTGTTIMNAKWHNVYLYTTSSYALWGTNQTSTVQKVGQTLAKANTVYPTITTKWSEDSVNILYY